MRRCGSATVIAILCGVALAACGSDRGPGETVGTAQRIEIPGAGEALIWGEGSQGVVLAHGAAFDAASWESEAEAIAEQGNLVLAVEQIGPEEILAAVEFLRDERSAERVALIGASAGADSSLLALVGDPRAVDQLTTLSVNSTAEGIGEQPKLFIASEDEGAASLSTELAASSDGDDNEALLLPGSAHAQGIFEGGAGTAALEAILDRLAPGVG